MNIISQEQSRRTGNVVIRLEGFPDEASAREALDLVLNPKVSGQLADAVLDRNESGYVVITGVCHFVDDKGVARKYTYHGTSPCVEV